MQKDTGCSLKYQITSMQKDTGCSLYQITSITYKCVFFSISFLCTNDDDIVSGGREGVGKL